MRDAYDLSILKKKRKCIAIVEGTETAERSLAGWAAAGLLPILSILSGAGQRDPEERRANVGSGGAAGEHLGGGGTVRLVQIREPPSLW